METTPPTDPADRPGRLHPVLASYLDARAAEHGRIGDARQALLGTLADWIAAAHRDQRSIHLLFVCTHNSRRSHMAQLWARAAAIREGIDLASWSGGTEATAFDPRAVSAMARAGFEVEPTEATDNPVRRVHPGPDLPVEACFSKTLSAATNPRRDFAAIMVCDDADRACPTVAGAAARFGIPFEDPKASDGTPAETATYDDRCARIAREMMWVMTRAAGR